MPLLSELERSDRVERLDLGRFDRDELAAQLEGILGEPADTRLVDELMERSNGLPFYVEELVAGGDGDRSSLPVTLRDILGIRLAALSDASLAVVRAAAVAGVVVTHDRLAAVTDVDDRGLLVALGEAVDAQILMATDGPDGPSYEFRHALLREAAADELLPAERVRLHVRLADHLDSWLDAHPQDASVAADAAVHAYNAHDPPRALIGAVRAVRALVGATAYREALGHAERALELWPQVPDAAERPARTTPSCSRSRARSPPPRTSRNGRSPSLGRLSPSSIVRG
jgi:predicted ATPase